MHSVDDLSKCMMPKMYNVDQRWNGNVGIGSDHGEQATHGDGFGFWLASRIWRSQPGSEGTMRHKMPTFLTPYIMPPAHWDGTNSGRDGKVWPRVKDQQASDAIQLDVSWWDKCEARGWNVNPQCAPARRSTWDCNAEWHPVWHSSLCYLPDCGEARRQVLSGVWMHNSSRIMWSQSTIMHLHLNWHDTAMLIWKLELNENTNHCVAWVQLIQYGSGYTCLSMKPFHLTYNYTNACQALFVMMQCFLVPNSAIIRQHFNKNNIKKLNIKFRGLQIILSYIFH